MPQGRFIAELNFFLRVKTMIINNTPKKEIASEEAIKISIVKKA
jgi:hypothetical protein